MDATEHYFNEYDRKNEKQSRVEDYFLGAVQDKINQLVQIRDEIRAIALEFNDNYETTIDYEQYIKDAL